MHEVISFFVTKYVLRIIEDFNVQQQIFYGQGMCFGKEWEFYARPNVTTQKIQEDNWKKSFFSLQPQQLLWVWSAAFHTTLIKMGEQQKILK